MNDSHPDFSVRRNADGSTDLKVDGQWHPVDPDAMQRALLAPDPTHEGIHVRYRRLVGR